MIDIVVARAHHNVIGKQNDLPWYLPADLRHFKELTTGGIVIMGRNTYDSIVARLHGPLPGRRNIVISTTLEQPVAGFEVYRNLSQALAQTQPDDAVHIIGGAVLYAACLEQNLVDRINLTEIDADIPGDVYFPELDMAQWQETARETRRADEKNPYDYAWITLEHTKDTGHESRL